MTVVLKSIYKFERQAEHFSLCHPYFTLLTMCICMPIFILIAVATSTAVIVFPIALIFGWL